MAAGLSRGHRVPEPEDAALVPSPRQGPGPARWEDRCRHGMVGIRIELLACLRERLNRARPLRMSKSALSTLLSLKSGDLYHSWNRVITGKVRIILLPEHLCRTARSSARTSTASPMACKTPAYRSAAMPGISHQLGVYRQRACSGSTVTPDPALRPRQSLSSTAALGQNEGNRPNPPWHTSAGDRTGHHPSRPGN